jgi:hypothetical protein
MEHRRRFAHRCTTSFFPAAGLAAVARRFAGYKFFEDQYPPEQPPERYATYEDQMLAGVAKRCEEPVVLTEHEKLVKLHTWEKNDKGGLPTPPANYGWIDEWGPEPGEEGHNEWYKKPREFMSQEEKAKFDIGFQVPLKEHHMRHQKLPYQDKIGAAAANMMDQNPKEGFSGKDKNPDVYFTPQQQHDHVGKARTEFFNEWLQKPGVSPENVAKKIGDYNGTAKLHNVKKLPRRPDWELAPQKDDDDDDDE